MLIYVCKQYLREKIIQPRPRSTAVQLSYTCIFNFSREVAINMEGTILDSFCLTKKNVYTYKEYKKVFCKWYLSGRNVTSVVDYLLPEPYTSSGALLESSLFCPSSNSVACFYYQLCIFTVLSPHQLPSFPSTDRTL